MSTRWAVAHEKNRRELETRCPICWDEKKEPYSTPCGHTFCKSCIKMALNTNGKYCPVCRRAVPSHRSLAPYAPSAGDTDALATGEHADDASSWECGTCTFVNPRDSIRCGTCDARRPAAFGLGAAPTSTTATPQEWFSTREAAEDDDGFTGGCSTSTPDVLKRPPGTEKKREKKRARKEVVSDDDEAEDDEGVLVLDAVAVESTPRKSHKKKKDEATTDAETPKKSHKKGASGNKLGAHLKKPKASTSTVPKSQSQYIKANGRPNVRPRVRGPEMSEEEARRLAAEEGLELQPAPGKSASGYEGIFCRALNDGMTWYFAQMRFGICRGSKFKDLGIFSSKWEAALEYARALGKEECDKRKREALTEEEAWTLAREEGLVLVPSPTSNCGYRGVQKMGGAYHAATTGEEGSCVPLGCFRTVYAAALAYARAIGPERCKNAHLAPPFRKSKESLMTEEQAKRIAAEEGIELIYSATNRHGFKGMHSRDFPGGTSAYSANIPKRYWPPNAKPSDTNCYSYSKWECALQYARALGPEGCKEAHRKMTMEEAERIAKEEGLQILKLPRFRSGLMGVVQVSEEVFQVRFDDGERGDGLLGSWNTDAEAALAYARHLGPEGCRRKAYVPPRSIEEIEEIAKREGVVLERSRRARSGFKGVYLIGSRGSKEVGVINKIEARYRWFTGCPRKVAENDDIVLETNFTSYAEAALGRALAIKKEQIKKLGVEGRLKAIEEDKKKPYNAAGFMTSKGVCGGTWDPDDKDDRLVDDDEEEEQEVMDVVEEAAEERGGSSSIAAPPIFVVGSRVDALYDDDFSYYPAVVRACHADGTFALDYTDGDKAERVPAASMRLRALENTRGIQAEMMRVRMERLAREQQC